VLRQISLFTALAALVAALAVPAASAQTTYSGQATALSASVFGNAITAGDTGPLPSSGGSQTASLASINLLGLLSVDVLKGTTSASGSESTSQASVADLVVGLLGLEVDVVQSQTTASCNGSTPSVSGSSELVNVSFNGQSLGTITTPNLTLSLLGITIVLNEQTSSTSGSTGDITVNAVHITGPAIDIVVASSHSDITCG
jgi:hypothetical protein